MDKKKKSGKVTVFDIAKELKISASTVSRSLNDHDNISKKTKRRVITMAKKMGYGMGTQYKEAKSISKLIALIIPSLESTFYIEYAKHLRLYLKQFEYSIVIFTSENKHLEEKRIAEQLTQFKLASAVVALTSESEDARYFKVLDEYNIPWIMFNQVDYQSNKTTICVDNYKATKRAISHFVGNGYKKIAHLAGHPNSSKYSEIVEGYKSALFENNLEFNSDYIIYSDLTIEDVNESMFRLLSLENPPNAIFIANSRAAIEVHHFLSKNNINIPSEVAIVSFGYDRALKYTSPSISHIQRPIKLLARKTSEIIIDALIHNIIDKKSIVLDAKFIIGKSSLSI